MSSDEHPNPDHDPMQSVAGALRQASRPDFEAYREPASTSYGFLGQMAYRASYGLSFGLIYPVAMLARVVPKENALIYGLHDGAEAARDEAAGLWRPPADPGIDPLEVPTAPHPA